MSEGIDITEDSASVEADDAATGEADRSDLSQKQRSQMRAIWEWVFVVVVAISAAMLIRVFLFQQYYIDGPSMQTTLMPEDRVLVNKMSYKLHDIHRGDVIVFDRVTNEVQHDDLIKRVLGLPGETLEIRSCIVYIDGVQVNEPYLNPEQTSQVEPSARCGSHTDMAPIVVPEEMVFVMGDNRVQSFDSRDFGPIDTDKVRGRAFVDIWPASDWAWL
jgi:signal peptidase I